MRRALWLLLGSIWASTAIVWWTLARSQPDPAFVPEPARPADSILNGVAPTSTRPHLLIVTTSGSFGARIQCFSPVDPAMFGQVVSVAQPDLLPTVHRLCNDPV